MAGMSLTVEIFDNMGHLLHYRRRYAVRSVSSFRTPGLGSATMVGGSHQAGVTQLRAAVDADQRGLVGVDCGG